MPTQEAIVNTVLPQEVSKPIPTRVVNTKNPDGPQRKYQDQLIPTRGDTKVPEGSGAKEPEESVRLSTRVSAMARAEQAVRQREQETKRREQELDDLVAKAKEYEGLKQAVASKDYSALEKLGVTYDEHTKYLIEKTGAEDPQAQALKAVQQEMAALKKSIEDSEAQQFDETVASYKTEIGKHVEKSSEYPRLKKLGKQDAALQLILDSWSEDGVELTVDEACQDIEAELTAMFQSLSVDEQKREEQSQTLPPPRVHSRTLSQTVSAVGTTPPAPQKSLHAMSDAERYAEARRRVQARREKGIF